MIVVGVLASAAVASTSHDSVSVFTVGGITGNSINTSFPTAQNTTARDFALFSWVELYGRDPTPRGTHANIENWLDHTEDCSKYYSFWVEDQIVGARNPSDAHGIGTSTIEAVADKCHDFLGLSMGFEVNLVTDAGYIRLFQANPNLEFVRLRAHMDGPFRTPGTGHLHINHITPTSAIVEALVTYCPKLQFVYLYGFDLQQSSSALVRLFQGLPFLVHFQIHSSSYAVDSNLMATLTNPEYLQYIRSMLFGMNYPGGSSATRSVGFTDEDVAQLQAAHEQLFVMAYGTSNHAVFNYGPGGNSNEPLVTGDPAASFYGRREDCFMSSSGINANGIYGMPFAGYDQRGYNIPGEDESVKLVCEQFCQRTPKPAVCVRGPQYNSLSPAQTILQSSQLTAALHAYSPSNNSWTTLAPMPAPRAGMCSSIADAIMYVTGGWDHSNGQGLDSVLNTVLSYDIKADSWSWLPTMRKSRSAHACAIVNGNLYVAGGYGPTQCAHCPQNQGNQGTLSVEAFNIRSGSWSILPDLPEVRVGSSAAVLGEKLVLAGGWNPNATDISSDVVMAYDLSSQQWALVSSTQSHARFALSGIRNGRMLFGLGHNGKNGFNTVMEEYSGNYRNAPASWRQNVWTTVSSGTNDPLYHREGAMAVMVGADMFVMGGHSKRVIPSEENIGGLTFGTACPEPSVVKFSTDNTWESTTGSQEHLSTISPLPRTSNSWGGVACGLMYGASAVYRNCSFGTFANYFNTGNCVLCPPGKYSAEFGQSSCKQCNTGMYGERAGLSQCFECVQGTYANETGSSSCNSCPSGRFAKNLTKADSEEAACGSCKAGQFSSGSNSLDLACYNCSSGRFALYSREGNCLPCSAGRHQPKQGQIMCVACAAGQFENKTGQSRCINCRGGYITNTGILPAATTCTACPSGTYSSISTMPCEVCAKGQYSSFPGHADCFSCNIGRYSDIAASTACIGCRAGYYGLGSAQMIRTSFVDSCVECPVGYFQHQAAQVSCSNCMPNKYQERSGQSACIDCSGCTQAGEYDTCGTSATKFASLGTCLTCPPGKYYASESSSCRVCPRGKYAEQQGTVSCNECAAGQFQHESNKAYCHVITPCKPGTYDSSNGQEIISSRCHVCPSNYFSASNAASSCVRCPIGKFQNQEKKFYCDEAMSGIMLKMTQTVSGAMMMQELRCPTGMSCTDGKRSYDGGIWHDPSNDFPTQQQMYTCVNDGCPPKGATSMSCREGYQADSPLCAICSEGYYKQLRRCAKCDEPQITPLLVAVFGVAFAVAAGAFLLYRLRTFLTRSLLALFKILVAFLTIVMTIDTQFGVQWPPEFLSALAFLSTLSFDLSAITSGFCLVRVSYYDELLFSTLMVALAVSAILLFCRFCQKYKALCIQLACYISLFAYPLVSVKVVACYDVKWRSMVVYASIFLVVYVIGLPVFILFTLWRYSRELQGRKQAPGSWLLGFLLDDYKLVAPAVLWEFVEIVRKLLLSVIGSLWSSKSPMAVATALLISGAFLVLHSLYEPFRSRACNRLQSLLMQCLTLLYFAGLLIKVSVVEEADEHALGKLLVIVLALMVSSIFGAMIVSVRSMVVNVRTACHIGAALKSLPQHDPPDDSDQFYRIQTPVERNNIGDSFEPKLPHVLSHIQNKDKLRIIHLLTADNEAKLDVFFDKLQRDWTIPLTRVKQPHEVAEYGQICVKHSRKTDESILAKAARPSILANNPRFSVEHVRDTFRFKGVVFSFRDALRFVRAMSQDRSLCPNGLSADCVAKLDVAKLRAPKEWGWRFVAFDFVMPNKQPVECYIVFTQMEAAKKREDPDAKVCPDLSNHEIFEKWRVKDTANLPPAKQAEFEEDKRESNRRYDAAYAEVLVHTTESELRAFWTAFGAGAGSRDKAWTTVTLQPQSNPMHDYCTNDVQSLEEPPMGYSLSDFYVGQRVTHLFRHGGVVQQVSETHVSVRFDSNGTVHQYRENDTKSGKIAIPSVLYIRELSRGVLVSHYNYGPGVVESVSNGRVSIIFDDGERRQYDKASLATGKLTLIETAKHQSMEDALSAIKSIKKVARGENDLKLTDFTPGTAVSHHFRGSGAVESVKEGQVYVRFERRNSVHRYSNEKIARGKLGIVEVPSRDGGTTTASRAKLQRAPHTNDAAAAGAVQRGEENGAKEEAAAVI